MEEEEEEEEEEGDLERSLLGEAEKSLLCVRVKLSQKAGERVGEGERERIRGGGERGEGAKGVEGGGEDSEEEGDFSKRNISPSKKLFTIPPTPPPISNTKHPNFNTPSPNDNPPPPPTSPPPPPPLLFLTANTQPTPK